MKTFDTTKLISSGGEFSGMIFEKKFLKIPLQLFFNMEYTYKNLNLRELKKFQQ